MNRLRAHRALLLVIILGAVGAGAAWWLAAGRSRTSTTGVPLGSLPHSTRPDELNLLLVTLDTTRADRIGAYGLDGAGTPNLDRLAAEGALFTHATTAAPITLPAHSSMFTGRFPPVHGVRDNGGFFLDPKQQTLAETLAASGFETGGFIGAYVLDSKWGVNQGFKKYFDDFDLGKYKAISLGAIQRPGNEVVDAALKWLDGASRSRFFAWVHLYDAHTPYEPPEPFNSRFPGRPYQGEISFADSQVGRLVSFLEKRNLLEKTVIVVVGDHGESLGDHGESGHGFFVYESVLHVPMIVRTPYALTRGRRVNDPVRTVDIMPTALDLLGVRAKLPPVDGVSVVPLLAGARNQMGLEAYGEALYPLHHFGWSDLRTLREGRFKVIAAPRPELYDLETDPTETKNVFADRRALGERMLQRLRQMEAGWAKAGSGAKQAPVEVDPDAKARLAALGYVGSFVQSAVDDTDRTALADPKDKIDLFNKISKARDISKDEGAFPTVVAMLEDVLEQDPKVIDAWFMLGNVHASHGKPQQAIEFFKKALALKPDDEMAVMNMANAYRNLGRDEEALVGYRRFLQLDPNNAQVRYAMAQILIDRDEYEEAAASLRRALELEPKMAAAQNALGVIALRRGDVGLAQQEIQKALQQKPDVRLAHFNLALIAEERQDWNTAIAEYEKELADHPYSYKAAFNLGKLYEQLGDRPKQEQAYRRAIDANTSFAEGYFYLAKLYLDQGANFGEAVSLARKGLELNPKSAYAPLGHYVIADIYNRTGRHAEAEREAAAGRRLEAQLRR